MIMHREAAQFTRFPHPPRAVALHERGERVHRAGLHRHLHRARAQALRVYLYKHV